MDYNQEAIAADTLLGRGVRYPMPAPPFIRWFKKTITLTIRKPWWGIGIKISKLYAITGIDPEMTNDLTRQKILELQAEHGITFSKIIALAVLNSFFLTWLVRPFAWYLRATMYEDEASWLIYYIVNFTATKSFALIIVSAAGLTVTSPPETSQEEEGS